jgi:putative flippase GtrA
MSDTVRRFLRSSGGRYLIVGGSVYVLELAIIVVAQHLGASPIVSVALSFWIGTAVSFVLQKFVTFGDKRTHHKIIIPQVIAVTLLVVCNFGFTVLMTRLLSHALPTVVVRTLALGITTIWNFYLYRTRIFTRSTSSFDSNHI